MSEIDELLERIDSADEFSRGPMIDALRAHQGLATVEPPTALRAARALLGSGVPHHLPAAAELALQAQKANITGAGVVFAEVTDRMSLMNGRPQRFGTVVVEHMGEAALAPLDGSVDDDVRSAMGIPPIAAIRANIDAGNRQRARDNAAAESIRGGLPYVRIWRDPTEADLMARWDAEGKPVWNDGEEITMVARSNEPGLLVTPVFQLPMWRVEGTDNLFAFTARVRRGDEAVLSYAFSPTRPDGMPQNPEPARPQGRWRGSNAGPEPARVENDDLAGSVIEHAVESDALGEPRKVTIYRPPNHDRREKLPVIYATDGAWFDSYARRLDPRIVDGTVPRIVVVAAHNAGFNMQVGNLRALEYLSGMDQDRFDRHARFFVTELSEWAEAELGVATERSGRAVFGTSDGGAFALTMGREFRSHFGTVFAFSSGVPPEMNEQWPADESPQVHLCAGVLEVPFHQSTAAWSAWLDHQGLNVHLTERVSGHDLIQWQEELPDAVARAWG